MLGWSNGSSPMSAVRGGGRRSRPCWRIEWMLPCQARATGDHPVGRTAPVLQSQNLSHTAHRHPLRRHRLPLLVPKERQPMQSSVERSPPTQWPASDRNRWPRSIETAGRLQIGISGRHRFGIGGRLASESALNHFVCDERVIPIELVFRIEPLPPLITENFGVLRHVAARNRDH